MSIRTASAYLAGILCLTACQPDVPATAAAGASSGTALDGAWRVAAAQTTDSTGQLVDDPVQETLIIFSDGYYSLTMAYGTQPSPLNAVPFVPTDAERLARVIALQVNAGTYEVTGTRLVTTPIVALNPGFVRGRAEYEVRLEGNGLTLERSSLTDRNGAQMYPPGGREVYRLERLVGP